MATPAPKISIPDPLAGQQTGTESSLSNWAGDYVTNLLGKGHWLEATEAASCGHPRPLALARKLADAHGSDVVITLGRCGMVCAERSGATWHLPSTSTEVRDVCGAGDTVLAALAVGMITGKSLRVACRAAMGAAGRQVRRRWELQRSRKRLTSWRDSRLVRNNALPPVY